MTEKVGFIKNPLTIIAIFAGIAEVSGTVVLPFVAESNQILFIYFLIGFPSILVALFFITLNFNNKVLYAPSDYKDEENYLKLNKYDAGRQETVSVSVSNENQLKLLYEQVTETNNIINTKLHLIEAKFTETKNTTLTNENISYYEFEVVDMDRAAQFSAVMNHKGYPFKVYKSFGEESAQTRTLNGQKAIWLGKNIPFAIAKDVIIESKSFFPHLQYIHISGDLNDISDGVPFEIHDQIFIGGSTETAKERYLLSPLSAIEFEKIEKSLNIEELHKIVRGAYPK